MPFTQTNGNIQSRYKQLASYIKTRDFYDLPYAVAVNKNLYPKENTREKEETRSNHARFIVYDKDVQKIYGKEDYNPRDVLQHIRELENLPKGGPVLITDFCKHTFNELKIVHKLMNKGREDFIQLPSELPERWKIFNKTKDWYDLPDSVEANNLLQIELETKQHNRERGAKYQLIIFPKHIEAYFQCSPEGALKYLQAVRTSQGLSIGTPVVLADINKHRQKWDTRFLAFIMTGQREFSY